MSIAFDLILIAVAAFIIIRAWKRGLVKSVIGLVCDVVAVVVAYALTPTVAEFFCKNIFLDKISSGIESTVRSAAATPAGTDVTQFLSKIPETLAGMLQKYNVGGGDLQKYVDGIKETGDEAVDKVSEFIAKPTSYILSNALAFILLFIVALILLRLISKLILVIFKAPVIKTADRAAGLVFGIVNALIVIWVLSLVISAGTRAAGSFIPNWFGETVEKSFVLKFFAKFNPIQVLNNVLERIGS